jgi:hypothetical protein
MYTTPSAQEVPMITVHLVEASLTRQLPGETLYGSC